MIRPRLPTAAMRRRSAGAIATAACFLAAPAHAANGLNAIGFGLELSAMAGADPAVARDPFALNTNPAGLAQLRGHEIELHGLVARELGIEHDDSFNPPTEIQNEIAALADLAAAQRLGRFPATVGASLAVTGGGGYDYGRIRTAFGNRDRLSSLIGIVRASAGGAVDLTDRLAFGVAVGLSYAVLDQKLFPGTSVAGPAGAFFGTRIDDARAWGAGYRLGVQYRVNDRLTLGAAYGSKVDLPVREGRLTANLTAAGLGEVRYDDLRIEGLAQARELGVGASYRLTPAWLVAADLSWLDWSGAIGTSTLRASDPDDPRAPPVLRATSTENWRDQWVMAVGTAYEVTDTLTLWAGYNHGRNPIPNEHLSPLLASIGQHHLTAGAGVGAASGRAARAGGRVPAAERGHLRQRRAAIRPRRRRPQQLRGAPPRAAAGLVIRPGGMRVGRVPTPVRLLTMHLGRPAGGDHIGDRQPYSSPIPPAFSRTARPGSRATASRSPSRTRPATFVLQSRISFAPVSVSAWA